MPKLRYAADAKDDLNEIVRYIAMDKPQAARNWLATIRAKCRLVAEHPEMGDLRSELGENIRSTYVGHYVIFFRRTDSYVDILRVIRGDRDTRSL